MRRIGVGHEADVADDLGLVVGRGPGHQDLRLGAQQRVDPVDLGAAGDDLVARVRLRCRRGARGCAPAGSPSTTAKHSTASVIASAAISWRSSMREGVEVGVDERRRGCRRMRRPAAFDAARRRWRPRWPGKDRMKRRRCWRRCGIHRAADEPYGSRRRSGSCPAFPIAPIRRVPGPDVRALEPSLSGQRLTVTPRSHGHPRINRL